jgi:hypothetical protein
VCVYSQASAICYSGARSEANVCVCLCVCVCVYIHISATQVLEVRLTRKRKGEGASPAKESSSSSIPEEKTSAHLYGVSARRSRQPSGFFFPST